MNIEDTVTHSTVLEGTEDKSQKQVQTTQTSRGTTEGQLL